jgi:hypothetical protein
MDPVYNIDPADCRRRSSDVSVPATQEGSHGQEILDRHLSLDLRSRETCCLRPTRRNGDYRRREKFIVRGTPDKTHAVGLNQRIAVIEFESLSHATAAHDAPAYQAALAALGDGAERDIRLVEGL